MTTRKRRLAGAAIVIVFAALVVVPAMRRGFAQGSAEAPATHETIAPAVFGMELDSAIAIASRLPEDWSYDPAVRRVFPEHVRIEYPIQIPDSEWRELLDPSAFDILRRKGTERPFSHPLDRNTEPGIYYSRATGQPLFSSRDKYDSGTGWPSFTRPINPDAIVYIEDNSLFSRRIEVVDSLSGSHLGHVFSDGPAPTGQRYCINGAALIFVPEGGDPPPIRAGAAH
jgi:peptide-methionine (R)-S-oxide reductase